MSFLGDTNVPVPDGHPSAQINAPGTVDNPAAFGYGKPAQRVNSDIPLRSMKVTKTNRGMEVGRTTGRAERIHTHAISSRAADVQVRSGNQDGAGVGVPDGFIWGLQGEGDAPAPYSLPMPVRIGGALVIGYLLYRVMRPKA